MRLVDFDLQHRNAPLYRLYSAAVEHGRAKAAEAIAAEIIPDLSGFVLLAEDDSPVLHLRFEDHSVPVGLAGEGIQVLVRLCLELASREGGLVLVEEPEVHQHPATIWRSALAILAAVRRGVQVILTTHSLELIDALLTQANQDELANTAVLSLKLDQGVIRYSRLPGGEAAFARAQIEEDLR